MSLRVGVTSSLWCLLLLVGGCVEPATITCEDGRVCPSTHRCDDAHNSCALPAQFTACNGKADFEPCTATGVVEGICAGAVCLAAGCGNKVIEANEVCDEGDHDPGDGCSADCRSNEQCGNGVIDDALGETCDDGNTVKGDGCQDTCRVAVCGDHVTDDIFNEECDEGVDNSQAPDAVCRKNCLLARCGDEVTDSNELCDDGNQQSNDGCRFDCLSDETCGNNVLDLSKLELCDDGNTLNHDGCGVCQPESISWRLLEVTPLSRTGTALAYDAARGRIVLFGGTNYTVGYVNDTWEWTGTGWIKSTPLGPSPPARRGHAMAYDAKRGVVVLFGGLLPLGANASLDDTWEWNGAVWKNVTPADSPPARNGHGMAYDAVRGKVVMFGGAPGTTSPRDDTWTWDGTTWVDVTPASASERPSPRYMTALAFDPKRGRIVLFGGNTGGGSGGVRVGDTWEWNGTKWSEIVVASPPETRDEHGLAFDASTGHVVMYGGHGGTSNSILNETWEWTGAAWTPAAAGPGARTNSVLAYDVGRSALVMFGGEIGAVPQNATYIRQSDVWTERIPATPPGRSEFAMTYDAGRARVVMFGGKVQSAKSQQTWELVDHAWIDKTPVSGNPSARQAHTLAYDPIRKRVVLFGGRDDSGIRDDTWEWDGSDWHDVTPISGNPGPREYHAMEWDAAHARIVMFGGKDVFAVGDAWGWNGTAWSPITPTSSVPAPRFGHGLAYDAVRNRIVLFGGEGSTTFGDTWELDGSTWTNVPTPATNPGPRRDFGMTYDAHRSRVVLYGGFLGTNVIGSDTWEWSGTRWTNLIDEQPGYRYFHSLAFDSVHGETVFFGGFFNTGSGYDQTWLFRSRNGDREESCHLGLDGDADTHLACSDDDCYAYCTPGCNSALQTCGSVTPRCGDGVCSSIESQRLCATDCGAPTVRCGDYVCDAGETLCPGDCPP